MKEFYEGKKEDTEPETTDFREVPEEPKVDRAPDSGIGLLASAPKPAKEAFTRYSADSSTSKNDIFEIIPDTFGEDEDYDQLTLYYYADGQISDSDRSQVDNPETFVGTLYTQMADPEIDSVYVQNDILGAYIEILREEVTYEEFLKKHPEIVR